MSRSSSPDAQPQEIRVVVDRDSVAAGDDMDTHVQEWTLPGDARVGDVVLRMLDGYLAGVGGDVAWRVVVLHEASVERDPAGAVVRPPHGRPVDLALLLVRQVAEPPADRVSVVHLHRMLGSRQRIAAAVRPGPTGEYAFRAAYLSGGRAVPLGEYRPWVEMSDEEEQGELAAFRARAYPQLYDADGRRRPR